MADARIVRGGAASERLSGSNGRDQLFGGGGRDSLYGFRGNDYLNGQGGRDTYWAGPGNDSIYSRDGIAETVVCGPGRDAVSADAADRTFGCESVFRPRTAPALPARPVTPAAPVAAAPAASSAPVLPSVQVAKYAGEGVWGYHAVASVTCRYFPVRGSIRADVPPPLAYAADLTPGAGNDLQLVRYRIFYVDVATGADLGASGWSAPAWAGDAAPAVWTGEPTTASFAWTSNVFVDIRFEFFDRTGAFVGWTAHRAQRYLFIDGFNAGPYGPFSSCARFATEGMIIPVPALV